MAETQTPSYLQQYLNEVKANQPDLSSIGERVTAATQNMKVPDQSGTIKAAQKTVSGNRTPSQIVMAQGRGGGLSSTEKAAGQAAITSFANQVGAAQRQSENQASALEARGEATEAYIGNLRMLGTQAVGAATESIAAWNRYTDTADQYLQDSAARMAAVTQDIKGTIEQYAATNDSALAHSIQSASHTWLQTNKAQERAIAERYGMESPEYRDWQDAKRASIGAMVSDLTAQAWDKTQTILNTGLGALAGAEVQLAEHVNLAQKNSLDALEAAAAAGDQFRLQTSSYLLSLAAAENTAWAELAEWIDASPVTAVDTQPLFAQLLELEEQSRMRQQTEETQEPNQITRSGWTGMKLS